MTRRNQSFDRPDLAEICGEPVFTYTRKQAIEDGVLVDLMQPETIKWVTANGFSCHVAMTATAWAQTVHDPDSNKPVPQGTTLESRLHHVLFRLRAAITERNGHNDRVTFTVQPWNGKTHETVNLWAHIGPGDAREPVLTIMLEGNYSVTRALGAVPRSIPHVKAERQADTVRDFLALFADGILANDLGPHLTCEECETFCRFLEAHGKPWIAATFREAHALSDDDGDMPEHVTLQAKLRS